MKKSEDLGLGEPLQFYKGASTLRFSERDHIYYLVLPDDSLEPLDGVTTVCGILDHSMYLLPWACKMMALKLQRTMPREEADDSNARQFTQSIPWADFVTLVDEAKKARQEIFEDAGDVGGMAHGWIEDSIRWAIAHNEGIVNEMMALAPTDARAENCGKAAFAWMQAHNVRWLKTERKIFSQKYRYAGTMDGLAMVDSCSDSACCKSIFIDQLSLIDWKSSNRLRTEYLYQTAAYQQAEQEEFGTTIKARWILRLGKEDGMFDPWYETDFDQDLGGFLACLSLLRAHRAVEKRMTDAKKLITFQKCEAKKAAKPVKGKR